MNFRTQRKKLMKVLWYLIRVVRSRLRNMLNNSKHANSIRTIF